MSAATDPSAAGRTEQPPGDPADVGGQEGELSVDGLGQRVGGALAWSFLNNVVSRIATVLSGIVLARLLAPEDYGVFAVALIVLNATLSMNELGVSLAIVRWPTGVEKIAPTVTTLAFAWSVVLYAACYLGAPTVASLLNAPGATTMIRILCLCVIVDAVSAVPAALLTRHFLQRRRMVIDLVSFATGTSVSIVLAIVGFGAWSILWGFAISNVIAGVLAFVLAPARYWPGFDLAAARSLLAFGLPLAGASVVLFAMLNADYVVVGHQLGPVELGLYLMAFNLCSWPVNLISAAIRRVSLAAFSRVASDGPRAGAHFSRATGLVMALTLPMCAYLAVFAAPTVELLYGSAWLPSADALRFLCGLGALRVGLELSYDYFVAIGRSRANFLIQVLWLIALLPALVVGARLGGIAGVALAHTTVAAVVIVPATLVVLRGSHVRIGSLARELVRPGVAAVAVAGLGTGVLRLFDGAFLELAVGGLLALAACAVVYLPLRHELRALDPRQPVAVG